MLDEEAMPAIWFTTAETRQAAGLALTRLDRSSRTDTLNDASWDISDRFDS